MSAYNRSELTPVMIDETKQIVLLPITNFLVTYQGNIRHDDILDMMVIDDASYNELKGMLCLNDVSEDVAKNLFIERCNAASGYGNPVISDTGYGAIYDELIDSGDNIESMLKNLNRVLMTYREATPVSILQDSDVDTEKAAATDAELLTLAINTISENEHQSYIADYMNKNEQVVLYSQG